MTMMSLVAIHAGDEIVSAGVLIAATTVLTACHCIEDIDSATMKIEVIDADLFFSVETATLHHDKDLGLINLAGNVDELHKYVARPHHSVATFDKWSTVSVFNMPALTGEVTNPAKSWRSERGYDIDVLELNVAHSNLGDYAGYSGGPVAIKPGAAASWSLGGIILEQYEDRADPTRFSNSLVGANIRTIGTVCPSLDAQIDQLLGLDAVSLPISVTLEAVASQQSEELKRLYAAGQISAAQLNVLEASMLGIISDNEPREA